MRDTLKVVLCRVNSDDSGPPRSVTHPVCLYRRGLAPDNHLTFVLPVSESRCPPSRSWSSSVFRGALCCFAEAFCGTCYSAEELELAGRSRATQTLIGDPSCQSPLPGLASGTEPPHSCGCRYFVAFRHWLMQQGGVGTIICLLPSPACTTAWH